MTSRFLLAVVLAAFGCTTEGARPQAPGSAPDDDGDIEGQSHGLGTQSTPIAGPLPSENSSDVATPPGVDGWVGEKFKFSAWGDSRPDNKPDMFEADYTARTKPIMTQIFTQAYARDAQFMLGSGDYVNAYPPDPGQLGQYLTAVQWEDGCKKQYGWANEVADIFRQNMNGKRPVYFALGNHEALGWTDLNSTTYDEKPNIKYYLKLMIPGLKPWYSVTFKSGADKKTISKIVMIAPNTWNADQKKWLSDIMKVKTNYTFVVRHESNDHHGCIAPGMVEQNDILKANPYTLLIEGHSHEYKRAAGSNEVVAGNGGAKFTSAFKSGWHGYLTIEQTGDADGKLLVRAWNAWMDTSALPYDSFKVTPDGKVSDEVITAGSADEPPAKYRYTYK